MSENEDIFQLGPVVDTPSKLKRAATFVRKPDDFVSVSKAQVPEYVEEGWEVDRELKIKTWLKKKKKHDKMLESKVWHFLFLLGYPVISELEKFRIKIQLSKNEYNKKQIDVFAKDDETVLIFECKSSIETRKRSLQKDIEEFANLKGPISKSIRKHYGTDFKPKILWFFVTENIIWSEPDKLRAKGNKINIITERELRYFLQIGDHLRSAARYQFLAEYLKDSKIPEMTGVKVPAIQGKLGGKKFYSFVSTPRQLLKISFVNHRSLNDPEGAPTYQRLVSKTRLRQVSKFIHEGGYFPNNILLNFNRRCKFELASKDLQGDVKFGSLVLPSMYRSAWIIDGQHRLYGYAPLTDKFLDQNIFVIAFENLKQEEEANLFVSINSQQKAVPKTLLDDLEGELKWGSENPAERIGAISARLIGLMNTDISSPFYGRVVQQGIKANNTSCLTVPAMKEAIKKSGLVGKVYKRREYVTGPLCETDDYKTLARAQSIINAYFSLVKESNEKQWKMGKAGHLCTNVSVQAFILLLASLAEYVEQEKAISTRELTISQFISELEEYIQPVLDWFETSSNDKIETDMKVVFGSGGPREFYYRLCKIINSSFQDFEPDGYSEWVLEQSSDRIMETDHKLKELNICVHKALFTILKNEFGEENYLEKGIADKTIRTKAYSKSLEDPPEQRLSIDNYLDFIEFKKIVENKSIWPLMKDTFNISDDGSKGNAKNTKWMERINELRRKPAHATELRQYKKEEFEYIDFIHEEFMKRFNDLEISE